MFTKKTEGKTPKATKQVDTNWYSSPWVMTTLVLTAALAYVGYCYYWDSNTALKNLNLSKAQVAELKLTLSAQQTVLTQSQTSLQEVNRKLEAAENDSKSDRSQINKYKREKSTLQGKIQGLEAAVENKTRRIGDLTATKTNILDISGYNGRVKTGDWFHSSENLDQCIKKNLREYGLEQGDKQVVSNNGYFRNWFHTAEATKLKDACQCQGKQCSDTDTPLKNSRRDVGTKVVIMIATKRTRL